MGSDDPVLAYEMQLPLARFSLTTAEPEFESESISTSFVFSGLDLGVTDWRALAGASFPDFWHDEAGTLYLDGQHILANLEEMEFGAVRDTLIKMEAALTCALEDIDLPNLSMRALCTLRFTGLTVDTSVLYSPQRKTQGLPEFLGRFVALDAYKPLPTVAPGKPMTVAPLVSR